MIALGSDHGGYALKEEIKKHLTERGVPFTDFGTDSEDSCDYPVYAALVTKAVVSGDAGLIGRIAAALRDPVWGGWIGRKCCIPATPVFQGVFPSEEEALGRLRALAGCGDSDSMQIFRECALTDPEAALYPDVPLDFAGRSFAPRALKEERHGG